MATSRRKYGTAIRTLTDPRTGEVLGWVYRWDTGEETTLWAAELPLGAVGDDQETGKPGDATRS